MVVKVVINIIMLWIYFMFRYICYTWSHGYSQSWHEWLPSAAVIRYC